MAMDMAESCGADCANNNALDNLFVYKLDNIEMLPKSRSSHSFYKAKDVDFI